MTSTSYSTYLWMSILSAVFKDWLVIAIDMMQGIRRTLGKLASQITPLETKSSSSSL